MPVDFVVFSTPGFIPSVVGRWMRQPVEAIPLLNGQRSCSLDAIVRFLVTVARLENGNYPWMSDFMGIISEGSYARAASVCLESLRSILRLGSLIPWAHNLQSRITVLYECAKHLPAMRDALLQQGSIPITVWLMHLITSHPREEILHNRPGPLYDSIVATLTSCVNYLYESFRAGNSLRWIIPALEAGLLDSVFKIEPFLRTNVYFGGKTDGFAFTFLELVKRVIFPYLVYPCVIRAAGKSIRNTDHNLYVSRLRNLENFDAMLLSVDLQSIVLFIAEKRVLHARPSICENPNVSHVAQYRASCLLTFSQCPQDPKDPSYRVLQCTGCRRAFYCSRQCFKCVWKSGHKFLCSTAFSKTLSASNNTVMIGLGQDLPLIFPSPDSYIARLISVEIQRFRDQESGLKSSLEECTDEKYRGRALSFHFDYSCISLSSQECAIALPDDLGFGLDETYEKEWKTLRKEAAPEGGQGSFILFVIPWGLHCLKIWRAVRPVVFLPDSNREARISE